MAAADHNDIEAVEKLHEASIKGPLVYSRAAILEAAQHREIIWEIIWGIF